MLLNWKSGCVLAKTMTGKRLEGIMSFVGKMSKQYGITSADDAESIRKKVDSDGTGC